MGNAADRPSRAEYGQATPGRRGWGGSPAGAEGEKAPSAPPAGGAGSGRLGDPVGSGPAGGGPRGAKGKRKSSSHKGKGHALIEVPRGIFSLLVNILMYALQQFMLLYVIISKTRSWLGLLFLIWDIPLLLYMCYSIKADTTADSCTSSRRCAVQWMTYTITVAVKMAAVAFVPSAYSDSSVALLNYTKNAVEAFGEMEAATQARHPPIAYFEEDMSVRTAGLANLVFSNNPHFVSQLVQVGESADNFLVYVGICLLPVIYVVFTARAKEAMYPTINQLVSVEGLLHADLGVALTLDMLDIVVMFRDSFSRYSNARWWGGDPVMKWICFAMVILTIVGVICLGFAFPTRSIDSRAITSLSQTDMFVSAKYAFLVGLFIVDIPFLALRIYWIVATDTISFFMFKNVYSLLTRPLRLNQCRLAEREKAKGTQKTFYDQDVLPEYREEEESEEAEEEEEETDDELQEEDEAMVPTRLPPGPSALGGSVSGPVPTSPALAQSPYYDPLYGNAPGQAPPHMGLPYGRGGPGPGAGGSLSGPGMPPHAGGSGGGGAGLGTASAYLRRAPSYDGPGWTGGGSSPFPEGAGVARGLNCEFYGDPTAGGGSSPYHPLAGVRGGAGGGAGAAPGGGHTTYRQSSSGALSAGSPTALSHRGGGPLGFFRRFSNARLSRIGTIEGEGPGTAAPATQMQPWAPSPHGFGDGLGPGGGRGDGGDRAGVSSGTGHHGGPYGPAAGPGGPFGNVAGGGSPGSPTALAGYAPPGGGLRRRFTQNLLHRRQSDLPPEGPSAGLSPEPVVYRHGSTMNTRAAASPRPAPPNAPRRSASPPVPPRRARGSTRRERKLLRDLEYVRGIPVSSIGFWASLYRFFLILFIGGREGLKTVLDDAFHLTWCEQIRLLIAPLGFHTMQGALFAMMALSVPTTWKRLPGIAAWPDFFPVSAWQSLSVVDRSAVVIIGISFAVELFAFTFTAPFFDVLFVAGGTVLRLLSEYLLIRSIAVSLAQQLPTTAAEQNGSRFVGFAVCCLFVIRSLYHVLALIVPGCFALCGKRLMTCRREKKKGYEQAPASDEWRAGVGHREVYSVSNALNFTVCRHFLSPISYNALLVGPDVVKGIRLLDNMAHAQLCDIMLTVGLQFYALTMHINWYDLGVFIGHDVFLGIYAVVGQTIRILAQRRFELKLLLDQLVLQRSIDFRLPGDDEEDVSDEGDLDTKGRKKDRRTIGIVTLADIEEEYQVEGFFSSPGNIFPQIF